MSGPEASGSLREPNSTSTVLANLPENPLAHLSNLPLVEIEGFEKALAARGMNTEKFFALLLDTFVNSPKGRVHAANTIWKMYMDLLRLHGFVGTAKEERTSEDGSQKQTISATRLVSRLTAGELPAPAKSSARIIPPIKTIETPGALDPDSV